MLIRACNSDACVEVGAHWVLVLCPCNSDACVRIGAAGADEWRSCTKRSTGKRALRHGGGLLRLREGKGEPPHTRRLSTTVFLTLVQTPKKHSQNTTPEFRSNSSMTTGKRPGGIKPPPPPPHPATAAAAPYTDEAYTVRGLFCISDCFSSLVAMLNLLATRRIVLPFSFFLSRLLPALSSGAPCMDESGRGSRVTGLSSTSALT